MIVEIEFSEVVVIAGGVNLQLELDVGAGVGVQSANATYFGGSGTTVLQLFMRLKNRAGLMRLTWLIPGRVP